jgi:G3E family GTPase
MLPTVVVGGYLGAGKTTLVNRVLRGAAGRRIAVVVNDFGEIGIDADLIDSRDGDVLNLAGGCVCCAVGSDLVAGLMALPGRIAPPDVVLIETSGVALPGAVARAVRLVPGLDADGIVVVADAETIRARADDPWVGDTVRQQLADADLLVLNKTDLIAPDALDALHAWLAEAAPHAVRLDAVDADVPPDAVIGSVKGAGLDAGLGAARGARLDAAPSHRARAPTRLAALRPAAADYETRLVAPAGPVDPHTLARALANPALGLLRAKGVVRDAKGAAWVVQAVGMRVRVTPAVRGTPAADPALPSRLVVIGQRGALDAAAIYAVPGLRPLDVPRG